MQLRLNTICLLVLMALTFGAWTHLDRCAERERLVERTVVAQQRMQSEIRLRSALEGAKKSPRGWVMEVKAGWFSEGRPENPLLTDAWRPWIDVAQAEQHALLHPTERIARKGIAAWWYNPGKGIVRARVPEQATLRRTAELYEIVNRTP